MTRSLPPGGWALVTIEELGLPRFHALAAYHDLVRFNSGQRSHPGGTFEFDTSVQAFMDVIGHVA
jgi:hypothetical protein